MRGRMPKCLKCSMCLKQGVRKKLPLQVVKIFLEFDEREAGAKLRGSSLVRCSDQYYCTVSDGGIRRVRSRFSAAGTELEDFAAFAHLVEAFHDCMVPDSPGYVEFEQRRTAHLLPEALAASLL